MALYARKQLRASQLSVAVPEGIEVQWVKVTPPSHPSHTASIIFSVVFHPPRAPTGPDLIKHIINTSDNLKLQFLSSRLLVCGDFYDLSTADIQNHIHLPQIVDFPTLGHNTLNLILTDLGDQYLLPKPLPSMGHSTHVSIFGSPDPTTSHLQSPTIRSYRSTPDSAVREFGWWLVNYPWVEVLTE